jgi:hypothetical protein
MSERPDYVPPWMNRLAWGLPPVFVMLWFLVLTPAAIWLLVSGVVTGSAAFIVSGLLTTLFLASQGTIYAPRAWRAMRDERADPN